MERGLLSDKGLAPLYDEVVWMYLYQDFSGSADDRRAERVAIRFGVSSWPQHLLIDPATLAILGSTGRTLDSFTEAVSGAPATFADPEISADELAANDALAERIQLAQGTRLAKASIAHEDPVVRYCAVAQLAEREPAAVVNAAHDLLAVHHDQLRYVVCKTLKDAGDARLARDLDALLAEPGESRNPNVVRINAAGALATCGDAASLDGLAAHGVGGPTNNGLTRVSLDAVAAIGARLPDAREKAHAILVAAFPLLPEQGPELSAEQEQRRLQRVTGLAKHVHGLLGRLTGEDRFFPETYDRAARELLVRAWS